MVGSAMRKPAATPEAASSTSTAVAGIVQKLAALTHDDAVGTGVCGGSGAPACEPSVADAAAAPTLSHE